MSALAVHQKPLPAVRGYSSGWLLDNLSRHGYTTVTGIPCSLFGDLFEAVEQREDMRLYPATREDLALGMAAGVALAGGRTIVAMQNSAVGMVLNATQSLLELYGLHALLLVSWRGEGPDAPEHLAMGGRMLSILEAAGIPYAFASQCDSLPSEFFEADMPVALIVRAGELKAHR